LFEKEAILSYQALTSFELEARYDRMAEVGREKANLQQWNLFDGWGEAPKGRTLLAATLDANYFVSSLLEQLRFFGLEQYVVAEDHYPLHTTVAQAEGLMLGELTSTFSAALVDLLGVTLEFNRLLVDQSGAVLLCGTEIAPELLEARAVGVDAFVEAGLDPSLTPPILHVSLARPRVGFSYERCAKRVLEMVGAHDESLRRIPTYLTVNGVYTGNTYEFLTQFQQA
jgi:hypothetical protein